jgi:hypothetical protein
MDLDSFPRTRKRARPLHQQLNSSSPAASTTPLSAVKRRKLDINGSSPSTPKALQALKTAIGGVFNFGRTKEISNGTEALETDSQVSKETDGATAVFDEFIDELLAEESQDQGDNGNNYGSEPHMAEHPQRHENGDYEPQISRSRRKGRRSGSSINAAITEDIDELLNDENHHDSVNGNQYRKKNFEPRQRKLSERREIVTPDPKPERKRKRSRTSVTAADAETAEDELSAVAEPPASSNSRKARAIVGTGAAEAFTKRNLQWHTRPANTKMASPDRYDGTRDVSVSEKPLSGSAGRPSRERRRPRRYSNEMLEDFKPKLKAGVTSRMTLDLGVISKSSKKLESGSISTPSKKPEARSLPTQSNEPESESMSTPSKKGESRSISTPSKKPEPRSILTPSKKMRGRPRKSVTFGVESPALDDQDLDLQDTLPGGEMKEAPNSAKKRRGGPKNATDPELVSPDNPSQGKDLTEDEASTRRDRNRRSPRQKVDAVPPQKLKPPKGREPPVEEALLIKHDGTMGGRRLRPPKEKLNTPSPEKRNGQRGREASVAKTSAPAGVDDLNSDDITCVICGGGDSQMPNEILLCDNCDLAAHQVCYGVQVIPEGDWLCRDCRPDEDEELILVDTGTVSELSLDLEASNIPDIEGFEYHMQVMQKLVLDKLTGQRRLKLCGLDEEYRKVHQVVEQTVLAGEGNSMLVIGARGCGKTAVSQPDRIL